MNYLQFYQILPWAKHSFNLDRFLLRNIQTVLGLFQSWWFTWQISNPWEISSGYFNNTMLELAHNECPHVNHGGRVKGLNLVEWEPKCFQFYHVCHSSDMSLAPFNQFPFQGHALIKLTRCDLSICDRTIHLLNIWATVPYQNFRELH